MGAGASPGVAAATKEATPNELESIIGTFSDEARGKLNSALSNRDGAPPQGQAGQDALFREVDKNHDGVIDASEWTLAQAEKLVPAAGSKKSALEALLDALDPEVSGRLDGAQVAEAIDLFNALEKPEPLTTSDDDFIQKPKIGKDGKVGRKALEALLTLFTEGPPARPMEQVVGVFQELYLAKRLFLEWAGEGDRLDVEAVDGACAVFDMWLTCACEGKDQGRTAPSGLVKSYDAGRYGAELKHGNFSKWLWEELKPLQEKYSQSFCTCLTRLREAMRIALICKRPEWKELETVDKTLLGPVAAACDGISWDMLQPEQKERLERSACERLSLSCADAGGRLPAKELLRWAAAEAIQLPVDRILPVTKQLEEFLLQAWHEEAGYRVKCSFQKWDSINRGSIGGQDLRAVLAKIGDLSPEEMDALMYGAPKKDGSIDYMEFTKWVMAAPTA